MSLFITVYLGFSFVNYFTSNFEQKDVIMRNTLRFFYDNKNMLFAIIVLMSILFYLLTIILYGDKFVENIKLVIIIFGAITIIFSSITAIFKEYFINKTMYKSKGTLYIDEEDYDKLIENKYPNMNEQQIQIDIEKEVSEINKEQDFIKIDLENTFKAYDSNKISFKSLLKNFIEKTNNLNKYLEDIQIKWINNAFTMVITPFAIINLWITFLVFSYNVYIRKKNLEKNKLKTT